jgi:hypothetical protein
VAIGRRFDRLIGFWCVLLLSSIRSIVVPDQ